MELTELESRYMDLIANCEMNSGAPLDADAINTFIWADERAAALGISAHALGGVMSSLQKKGLIWLCLDEADPNDNGVGFTEDGFQAWKEDQA